VTSSSPADEVFPGAFGKPTAVFISGSSRTLLKWFAFASLSPYASRVYWTDVRLPGELLDPLDPMAVQAIPAESVYVLTPGDLRPDDQRASQAETAAATMLRSDEPPSSLQGLVEFLRLPPHAQRLVTTAGRPDLPGILVTANAHRLASIYPLDRVNVLMRTLLESGTCQVALWAEAPTTHLSMFDVVLHLEGGSPTAWRSATLRSERGIASGPLASGRAVPLPDLKPIATILSRSIPSHSGQA
jgi:hypothetical protein